MNNLTKGEEEEQEEGGGEEEEQSLVLPALGQPWAWGVSDFIFLALAYEGG